MPFELRPYPHPTLRPEDSYLQNAWEKSVYPLARQMGIPIRLPPVSPQPHTGLAFEGLQFAKQHGRATEYNHAVFVAFFQQGKDIGNIDVLEEIAGEVGLDKAGFRRALQEHAYRDQHRKLLREAYEDLNITAVPTIMIGEKRLTGLYPEEVIAAAIEQGRNSR